MAITNRISKKMPQAEVSGKSNVEVLVEYVLDRCTGKKEAELCFATFARTAGQDNPTGRCFTKDDIELALKKYNSVVAMYSSADGATVRAANEINPGNLEVQSALATLRSKQREVSKEVAAVQNNLQAQQPRAYVKRAPAVEHGAGVPAESESKKRKTAVPSPQKKGAKAEVGKRQKKSENAPKKGKQRSSLVDDEALFGSESEDGLSGEEEVDRENEDDDTALLDDLALQKGADIDDLYPAKVWEKIDPKVLPGHAGFNERASKVMHQLGVGLTPLQSTFDKDATCPPLQPHQESVAFLLHPSSPISRLLIDHPTGSGKTREMIRTLDNYFFDPRPKIPIFPKDHVCRNFYAELLRWPNRYRHYFCCERPADALLVSGVPDWRERRFHMWDLSNFPEIEVRRLCYGIREVLEMKGMFHNGMVRRSCKIAFNKKAPPGEHMPRAPLRALGYTSAGGAFSNIVYGKPASSLMKIGYEKGSNNVYNNKVVLMDEVHNLLITQTQYGAQLSNLKTLLYSAKNLVLAGFTGTPILNNPKEGQTLLQIIKGFRAPKGDEGFLSSFPMRPQQIFPASLPHGIPDGILTEQLKTQLVKEVEIHGEALKIYEWKRRSGYHGKLLRAYCNCSTYHGSFHEGKSGTKIRVLSFPEDCCPKLLAIALEVASKPDKAVIMTSRMSGYNVMLELMNFVAMRHEKPFWVATMDELSEFNHVSNLRGEVYRVLVADAAQCSEGISFLAVRRTFISDVPASPAQFKQQCGRAIRMYGHRGLPQEEQTVVNQLYVAKFPQWVDTSLAIWSLRAQSTSATNQVRSEGGKEFEKKAQTLLSRLNKAAIMTLDDLKKRVDAFALELSKYVKVENLSSQDIVVFLEQNGLAEEAKLLSVADKKDWERALVLRETKKTILQHIEVSQQGLAPGALTTAVGEGLPMSQDNKINDADIAAGDEKVAASSKEELQIGTGEDRPFDGEWEDGNKLTVQIKGNLLLTADGVRQEISFTSPTVFEIPGDDGKACQAHLSADRMKISWSDGDEWLRVQGRAAAVVLGRAIELLRPFCQAMTSSSGSSSFKGKSKNQPTPRATGDPSVGDSLPDGSGEMAEDIPMPGDDVSAGQLANDKSQLRESIGVIAARWAELVHDDLIAALMKTIAPDFSKQRMHDVTLAQVRTWHDEFVRLHNFALCMQALAAVQSALQEMTSAPSGESWRSTLAEQLQQVQSEELETAMDNARIPADISKATPAQVQALRGELENLKVQGDVPQTKSRALVLALQALHTAATVEEASQSLKPETADEEALRHLMLQTRDFAPALSDLRSVAVDREVLSHLADQSRTKDAKDSKSDAKKPEVKRSKSMVSEVVPGQVVKLHSLWSKPELNGQLSCTSKLIPESGQWECRILSSVRKETVNVDPSCFTFVRSSEKTTREMQGFIKSTAATSPTQLALGRKVRLHSLQTRPELNDQIACVEGFDKGTERWDCRLLLKPAGETLKLKEANLAVVHDVVDTSLMPSDTIPAVGNRVMLHSLVAKQDLNGQLALIERIVPETMRWECALCSKPQGEKFNLKASSLAVVVDSNRSMVGRRLLPGRSVRLHSLKARPELNGQLARVERLIPESGRWECQLFPEDQGEKLNLNGGNLALVLEMHEVGIIESGGTEDVPKMPSDDKSSSNKDSGRDSERQKEGPNNTEVETIQRKRKADAPVPKSMNQKSGLSRVEKLLKTWQSQKKGGKK